MALGTPTDGGAAYSAAGGGGTTVAPAYPSGIQANDVLVLIIGQKPSTANGGTVTTPTSPNWTLRESITGQGGYGTTLGADTGNTNLFIYTKDVVDGTETGNLTVTVGTNNVCWGLIVRIPGGGGTSFTFGTADGSRATAPTSGTAFTTLLTNGTTAPNLQSGDIALWAMCIPTDVLANGFTVPTISSTGTTFGTAVELEEPDSGNGNDIGGYVAYAEATSGSSTAAPTVGVTATGTVTNVRGPIALIRIRDTSQELTPSLYTNGQTFYAPTVAVGTVTLAPALYSNDQTFYSPDVTQSGGAVDLQPALVTNGQTFYAPTVTSSNTLAPARYDNGQTFYAPAVTTTATLTPTLFTNGATFYAPSVVQDGGPQALLPDPYSNGQTFYAATVQATAALTPALYSNAGEFYAPTVGRDVAPGLFTNTPTFFAATVGAGASTQALACDDYVDPNYVAGGYVSWPAFNANQFFGATVTSVLAGGGYDDKKPRKKRYVAKVGDKLVVFANARDAQQALKAQKATESQAQKPAKNLAQAPKSAPAAPEPIASVPMADIRALAAERTALNEFQHRLKAMQYEALLKLYEEWQDEQDIEALLLAI